MGVVTFESEVVSPIPPAKMFKAFLVEGDKLIPKLVPQAIKSVEVLEGDGGAGTVKQINFAEGSPVTYMKNKVEAVDQENLTYCYTTFEGDVLMGVVEKIAHEVKLEASPDGGSICKTKSTYYPIGDHVIDEAQVKIGKEKAKALFKAIEAHLLANPDAC